MKTLHIFILHCKALEDRYLNMNNIVMKLRSYEYKNIKLGEISIIGVNDPDDIPTQVIQQLLDYSPIQDVSLGRFNPFLKHIHINQLSSTLKHAEVYQRIAMDPKKEKDSLYLVLEDDALCSDNVCVLLDQVVQAHTKQPIVFLGIPSNNDGDVQIKQIQGQLVPVIDSYMLTLEGANMLRDHFLPVKFTSVLHFNYVLAKCNIPINITSQNLFVNGSKYGMFVSSLNPNNQLVFNKDYMMLFEKLNKPVLGKDDERLIKSLISESPISQSPDFRFLVAKYQSKIGQHQEAKKTFEEAFKSYIEKKGIINNESNMLKDYIRLFKNLQELPSS